MAVTAGELSPIASGLVYCGVILGCQAAYEPRRAQEWTAALTQWCEQQPDMVAFTGRCLTHRAEIMCLHGAWPEALQRGASGRRRALRGGQQPRWPPARPSTCRARSTACGASSPPPRTAYREASRCGREPQPGLALLRLAQGDARRRGRRDPPGARRGRRPRPQRARLLPAQVEIAARRWARPTRRAPPRPSSERIAEGQESGMLGAMAASARGAVELAAGDAGAALVAARRAARAWQQLEAPYEAARARALVGLACRALGDDDTAAFELEAARGVFAGLGAAPDLARVEALARAGRRPTPTA